QEMSKFRAENLRTKNCSFNRKMLTVMMALIGRASVTVHSPNWNDEEPEEAVAEAPVESPVQVDISIGKDQVVDIVEDRIKEQDLLCLLLKPDNLRRVSITIFSLLIVINQGNPVLLVNLR
ncbi:hypothetical protein TYRP_023094, partial [Tyrophagus putrescentiae]